MARMRPLLYHPFDAEEQVCGSNRRVVRRNRLPHAEGPRLDPFDLAKASGMNADWLGVLEMGRNKPSLNTVLRLARAFGVSAATIVRQIESAQSRKG
jgi:transcriptional regulator with XRE-family HTH domain